jgi:hypothetical protein
MKTPITFAIGVHCFGQLALGQGDNEFQQKFRLSLPLFLSNCLDHYSHL